MISNHLGQIFQNFQNFVPKVRSIGRGFKCINVSSSRHMHFGIAALVPLEMWYIFAQVEFTAVDCF